MSKNNTVFIGENKKFRDRNRRSGGYLLKRRSKQIALSVVRALLLFGLCFMIIQPLLTRLAMSIMEERDLYDSTIILLPRNVTLENYKISAELTDIMVKHQGTWRSWTDNALFNTLWVSLLVAACQIVSCTLVAYGFARFEFKGKKFWFGCVVALIIIPPQTIQAALYRNFSNFDFFRVFTLFGVNAEGKDFGQRILSVFDGSGTGILSLLSSNKDGLSLGERRNLVDLFNSGVISKDIIKVLGEGTISGKQMEALAGLFRNGTDLGKGFASGIINGEFVVTRDLLEAINSGKLPIAHLLSLKGTIPNTDFLFSGVPLNLRSNISAYVVMSLTCMGLKNGLYIYMMRQYFQGIPTSLEEAAYVDGCGTMHTFVKIMLPDALPTIASCFLFSFVWQWTDIFYTRLFLPIRQLPIYSERMSSMVSQMGRYFSADADNAVVVSNGRQQQLLAIAVLICAIPLIILYLFTQRTFVESLASSGSKE